VAIDAVPRIESMAPKSQMKGINVTDGASRISRRKLLQLSGLAPLVALAATGASYAELAAAAEEMSTIPRAIMDELVAKATVAAPTVDKDKFRLAVRMLWRFFELGAYPMAVSAANLHDVLIAAYVKKNRNGDSFGDLVAKRLGRWDASGRDDVTNTCASTCGQYAGEIASAPDGPQEITVNIFNEAWDETEDKMVTLLKRARRLGEKRGRKIDDVRIMGNGC